MGSVSMRERVKTEMILKPVAIMPQDSMAK